MRKRVYIAGPMRGHVRYNLPAFLRAREAVESMGHEWVCPHDLDAKAGFNVDDLPDDWDWNTLPDGLDMHEVIRRDLAAILGCDAIYKIPGWQASVGATAESNVAAWLGLEDLSPTETILDEAARITSLDRQQDYGHPADDFKRTADACNAILGTNLAPEDFGKIMVIAKLARDAHRPKRDNLTDIAGYARTIEMCRERGA